MKASNFLISEKASMREAIERLNTQSAAMTLFVLDGAERLVGSLTDGDVRRKLIEGKALDTPVSEVMFRDFRSLSGSDFSPSEVADHRNRGIKLLPVLDEEKRIKKVLDLAKHKTYLSLAAILMAGGKGERLRPLTNSVPKPLLEVGGQSILERNINRLTTFGITDIQISINYLGDQIQQRFHNFSPELTIHFLKENEPLGTIGCIRDMEPSEYTNILVMNGDILTNLDFESFYQAHIDEDSDLTVATTPYEVRIPYAVIQTDDKRIIDFKEKPTYTYYSNAGIYLMKKTVLKAVPSKGAYDATDLIESLIQSGRKVSHFPILGYWTDSGSPEDLKKAQEDIKYIRF